ncbi:MAG TPA: hypothetical protein VFK32_07430 [Tepidiformaceae bacterium]|nr:hypothetical protein [Tepidiformaceae bacterium]
MPALSPAEQADLQRRVQLEARRLHEEFSGIYSTETIERFITDSFNALDGARLPDFVPVFTRRFARERLRAAAQGEGLIAKDVPEILYVCVQNAGRSQLAAGLTKLLAGDRVNVRSAGSAPAEHIHPVVRDAAAQLGIDLTEEFPKPLTDEFVRAADAVITMGCGDACPIYPGKKYEDWEVADPAHASPDEVAGIAADIRARVERLLRELNVAV